MTHKLSEAPELLCHMVRCSMWVRAGWGAWQGGCYVGFSVSVQIRCGLNYKLCVVSMGAILLSVIQDPPADFDRATMAMGLSHEPIVTEGKVLHLFKV